MKFDVDKISSMSLITLNRSEKKEIVKRLNALKSYLDAINSIETPSSPIILAPEGINERADEPIAFDSDKVLASFHTIKNRYIKAPRTL
ncbi:MAG: hypothetical protein JRN32_03130 [Nitrososphaerota archaeon]|nr:hypothetical protein [Nitrososphaerota archaeon]MDG7035713.1 hypothetical protein [Nitrososphaerota archaeon]MDG7040315.1 hypothetical protein [Nitrososphaerota archaeon]MDG7042286.1 hypothetical protein [Nitrososphaerota archaeon]MDG7042687.1 hypothetical protein [Nitrososphaerota archaeon]